MNSIFAKTAKSLRAGAVILLVSLLMQRDAFLQELDQTDIMRPEQSALTVCTDEEFGMQFLCDPNWQIEVDEEALLIIISEDPAVTLTIAKTYTPVSSLSQLDRDVLKAMGQYADGFETERLVVANRDALKVEAFPEGYPEMKLLDYYLINDADMYSFLFSVVPEEAWDNYQSLIEQITESFAFIPAGE